MNAIEPNRPVTETDPNRPAKYQVRVQGHLGCEWSEWFDGLAITLEENGDSLLSGPVADQAALHGLLKKVRDLGLPLVSVVRLEPGEAEIQANKSRGQTMKAVVWTAYGPPEVLKLREVGKPVPKANEVLIKIRAATVTIGDCDIRRMRLPLLFRLPLRVFLGMRRPQRATILGQELAGEIEAVGNEVTRFKPGDLVFSPTFFRFGAYAEYACLPETYPVLKPAGMTYEEAVTLPIGGMYGLNSVTSAGVRAGQKVAVNGAGGSIGTYAVQLAKSLGAEVTAIDSAEKLPMLRSLGADHVYDYTREDFTRSGRTYDAVIDVVGKAPSLRSIRSLKRNGVYVAGNLTLSTVMAWVWALITSRKVTFEQPRFNAGTYARLERLIEAGKMSAIIDRCYPLERTAEAHWYVEQGHKKGSVVITVGQDDGAC